MKSKIDGLAKSSGGGRSRENRSSRYATTPRRCSASESEISKPAGSHKPSTKRHLSSDARCSL